MEKSFDFLIDSYLLSLNNRNLSELTITSYSGNLARFIAFLEKNNYPTDVNAITKDHIEMYLASLKHPKTRVKDGVTIKNEKADKTLEATTRRTVISSLRSFFKWCHLNGYISNNPAALIMNPKTAKKSVKTVSNSGVKKLFKTAEDSSFPTRDKLILALMLLTGPRVQEVAQLKLPHVNLESRKIFINGKGGKDRELYMNDEIYNALLAYLPERERMLKEKGVVDETSLLISQKQPKGLSKRGLQHIITNLANKGHVTTESGNQVSAHKLRHTFATNLYNNNEKVDVLLLGEVLGHSNPNSTKVYTRISPDVIKDVLNNTNMYNT